MILRLTLFILCLPLQGNVLQDITLEGQASQSHSHGSGLYPAENAIDGDLTSFNHTSSGEPGAAWFLDFSEEKKIDQIEIVPRDCCSGRLNGATLRLFDEGGGQLEEIAVVDGGPLTVFRVIFPNSVNASQVRIGFEPGQAGIVHMAEMRVFSEVGEPPVILDFSASGNVLSWEVEGAETVSIFGLGEVGASGSQVVSPAESTAYILSAVNPCDTVTATVGIEVGGQALRPRITEIDAYLGDWVEIWNPGNEVVDLSGWALTDDIGRLDRWVFPEGSFLESGEFLVVDEPFGLAREAGSLVALVDPTGGVVSQLVYPRQHAGASYGEDLDGDLQYFLSETPGDYNLSETTEGFLEGVTFSATRGFYEASFSVALSAMTPGASLLYSVDGEEPNLPYSAPISVSTTTVLRAREVSDGFVSSPIECHSYLFLSDVANQPEMPAGFPLDWQPAGSTGALAPIPRPTDYEMDPLIQGDMIAALQQVPTISLTLPNDEMWGLETGIHPKAENRGRDWEKEVSMEVLDPVLGNHAHYNCGIRIHGGRGRVREMLRKSFRLYFRSDYGDPKFDEALFPGMPSGGVDHLVLRGGTGRTWASPWRDRTGTGNSLPRVTYLRDQFYRDCQRAMGNQGISGGFAHLYINGLYWGLYNPVERPGENYGANHFGGDEEDYDVLKWANNLPTQVTNGEIDGWEELRGLTGNDPSDNWDAIQQLLNVPELIDYMMVNFYVGNQDWVRNNVYAFRRREGGTDNRFRFLCWDGEEILLNTGRNSTTDGRDKTTTPLELHDDLRAGSEEYRLMFADRLHQHMIDEDGVLTVEKSQARHAALSAGVDQAIIAESARWGDLFIDDQSDPGLRYNREDHWLSEVANIEDNYLTTRTATSFRHMKDDNLYPETAAPVAEVEGTNLTLTAAAPIYFTTDGSDPRLPGGMINSTAQLYDPSSSGTVVLGNGASWSYLDDGSDLSGTGWVSGGFDDSSWVVGPAPLGYGGISGAVIATEISHGGDIANKHITSYFRHRFIVTNAASVTSLTLNYFRDDGIIIYLNGVELERSNLDFGPITAADVALIGVEGADESEVITKVISEGLLMEGENVIAVELHQRSKGSSDLGFDLSLVANSAGVPLNGDARIRSRVLDGGEWSALEDETFRVQVPATSLIVTEVMYHPADPSAAEMAAGFDDDDFFEFIEVKNTTSGDLLLDGFRFSKGVNVPLSGVLAPGEFALVVANREAFEMRYGAGLPVIAEWPAGNKLDNGGELIRLRDHEDVIVFEFAYDDENGWSTSADGSGQSLVLRRPTSYPDLGLAESWRASLVADGNPAASDATVFQGGEGLIAYAVPVIGEPLTDGTITAELNTLADDVTVTLESSPNLMDWNTVVDPTITELHNGRDLLSFTPPAGNEVLFYRFRVSN